MILGEFPFNRIRVNGSSHRNNTLVFPFPVATVVPLNDADAVLPKANIETTYQNKGRCFASGSAGRDERMNEYQ